MDRVKDTWKKTDSSMRTVVLVIILVIIILVVLIIIRRTMVARKIEEGSRPRELSNGNESASDSSRDSNNASSDSSSSDSRESRAANSHGHIPTVNAAVVKPNANHTVAAEITKPVSNSNNNNPMNNKLVGSQGVAPTEPTCGTVNCNGNQPEINSTPPVKMAQAPQMTPPVQVTQPTQVTQPPQVKQTAQIRPNIPAQVRPNMPQMTPPLQVTQPPQATQPAQVRPNMPQVTQPVQVKVQPQQPVQGRIPPTPRHLISKPAEAPVEKFKTQKGPVKFETQAAAPEPEESEEKDLEEELSQEDVSQDKVVTQTSNPVAASKPKRFLSKNDDE